MHNPFPNRRAFCSLIFLFLVLSSTQLSGQLSLVVEGGVRTNFVKMYGSSFVPFVHLESMFSPTIGVRGSLPLFKSKWDGRVRLFSTVGKHLFLKTTLGFDKTYEYQDYVNYESITYDFRMKVVGADLMIFRRFGKGFSAGLGAQISYLDAPVSQTIQGEYTYRFRAQIGSGSRYEIFDEPISQRTVTVFDESFFLIMPLIELGWQSGRWSLFGNVRLGMNEQSTAFKVREGPIFSGGIGYSLVNGK